jgi:hypothetical protein
MSCWLSLPIKELMSDSAYLRACLHMHLKGTPYIAFSRALGTLRTRFHTHSRDFRGSCVRAHTKRSIKALLRLY